MRSAWGLPYGHWVIPRARLEDWRWGSRGRPLCGPHQFAAEWKEVPEVRLTPFSSSSLKWAPTDASCSPCLPSCPGPGSCEYLLPHLLGRGCLSPFLPPPEPLQCLVIVKVLRMLLKGCMKWVEEEGTVCWFRVTAVMDLGYACPVFPSPGSPNLF